MLIVVMGMCVCPGSLKSEFWQLVLSHVNQKNNNSSMATIVWFPQFHSEVQDTLGKIAEPEILLELYVCTLLFVVQQRHVGGMQSLVVTFVVVLKHTTSSHFRGASVNRCLRIHPACTSNDIAF